MKKRILAFGDTHAGHVVGLTHPRYQFRAKKGEDRTKHNKFAAVQRELWGTFDAALKRHGPFDGAIFVGDAIDGKGRRSGGTEQITTCLEDQCDMAADVVNHVRLYAKRGFKVNAVYGTGYHVSGEDGEDWENVFADRAGIDKIGSHEWVEIAGTGVVFDVKHHVGSSSIPHGRGTAILKEMLWNDLWHADDGMQPRAHILMRGHVHYHCVVGMPGMGGMRWAMTLPALQGMGSKYGARVCSGKVHFGVVVFEVRDDGTYDFVSEVTPIISQRAVTTVM